MKIQAPQPRRHDIGDFVSESLAKLALEAHSAKSGTGITRALVLGPYLKERPKLKMPLAFPATGLPYLPATSQNHSVKTRFDEAIGLGQAIGLDIVSAQVIFLSDVRPATYLGKGKVEELAAVTKSENIDLVVMDCALSPVQQRNLEQALAAKVIDRTGLILEIFGNRARTREGTLQVELAHLAYQKSRLVRSWTHLERQRGGFGFLGGPGETQIETDRRLIQERMSKIERELEGVKRTRGLHRKNRRDVPYPIVALVGYTNAGKSTLFNTLTKSQVFAEDMLFATLDPTLRRLKLPKGCEAIVSDTVGFISDLPTMLVSAFRATLEEVLSADVILHVRDIAHPETDAQSADVENILKELGIDPASDERLLQVWNKADLLDEDTLLAAQNLAQRLSPSAKPMIVSALTGQGTGELCQALEERLTRGRAIFDIKVDAANGEGLSWLYANTEVLERESDEDGATYITVRVPSERVGPMRRRFFKAEQEAI